MLTKPKLHPGSTSVGELRRLFLDDHVHMALLVHEGRLVTAIERRDLSPAVSDETPARLLGRTSGRTISPDVPLGDVLAAMRQADRRRLAVVGADGMVVGMLGLKANGRGFCSDRDVERRASDPAAKHE